MPITKAVIGGLINSEERTTVFKIPILSTLPGLGKIFRNVRTDKISTEIVMFITPVISIEAGAADEKPLQAELLEKAENRSAEISSTSLGVMDRNTDYYKEKFPSAYAPELAVDGAIQTPSALELSAPPAAPATFETVLAAPPSITNEIGLIAETVETAITVKSESAAEKNAESRVESPAGEAVGSRYDYNEKLKQILNKIRSARRYDSSQTSSVIIK